ncbi:hypothetical protein PUN28_019844 [Cardiocondyla obscurior]|uniref:Uncharacterized protein n=1 Tax=Cardiocondyla obscurior TaxID=286306 RepID=A0AAW2E7S5_9HYME
MSLLLVKFNCEIFSMPFCRTMHFIILYFTEIKITISRCSTQIIERMQSYFFFQAPILVISSSIWSNAKCHIICKFMRRRSSRGNVTAIMVRLPPCENTRQDTSPPSISRRRVSASSESRYSGSQNTFDPSRRSTFRHLN